MKNAKDTIIIWKMHVSQFEEGPGRPVLNRTYRISQKNFLYSQKLVSITISRLCAVNIDPKDA